MFICSLQNITARKINAKVNGYISTVAIQD